MIFPPTDASAPSPSCVELNSSFFNLTPLEIIFLDFWLRWAFCYMYIMTFLLRLHFSMSSLGCGALNNYGWAHEVIIVKPSSEWLAEDSSRLPLYRISFPFLNLFLKLMVKTEELLTFILFWSFPGYERSLQLSSDQSPPPIFYGWGGASHLPSKVSAEFFTVSTVFGWVPFWSFLPTFLFDFLHSCLLTFLLSIFFLLVWACYAKRLFDILYFWTIARLNTPW